MLGETDVNEGKTKTKGQKEVGINIFWGMNR